MRIASTRIIWVVLALVWGSTWLFIKVGLQDLPPFTFAWIRFVVALVPLLAVMGFMGLKLPKKASEWGLLSLTGILTFTLGYGLVFWGEQYISSGLTSVLFTTYPLFGLFFAHWLLASEPLTGRRIGGAVLGMAGVVLIFSDQLRLQGAMAVLGGAAVLLSSLAGALSGVIIKRWGGHLNPFVVTAVQMVFGGLPLLALGLITEGSPSDLSWTPKALFSLFYLALVGTSLAFVLWYKLLQSSQVTRAQFMPVFNTLVAVVLGWLVLREHYGVRGFLGGGAVLFGLALALWRPRAEGMPGE
jgi:drug/metabolite transporter (DMT)-like permease